MPFLFEKLLVYQKAIDLADRICGLTRSFPKEFRFLSDQLNRAAVSVPTNLAEGNGRWHGPDRKQFFWIARGSAQECVPLLEIGKRRGLLLEEEHQYLRKNIEEISKMLTGLIQGVPDRSRGPR